MKIVIADDEKYIRLGLKSMFFDLHLPLVVEEAANGEELIKIVKTWHPDLALVDIKMPGLNGLEAIKIMNEMDVPTKWCILTTHTKFNYAKEAIELNVIDYLLKPVKPEQLKNIIQRTDEMNKEQAKIKNQEIENKIHAIFDNISSLEQDSFLKNNKEYKALAIIIDSCLDGEKQLHYKIQICTYLRNTITHYISNSIQIILLTLNNGELTVLALWEKIDSDEFVQAVNHFFFKIIRDLQFYNKSHFNISMLETDMCSSFPEVTQQIKKITDLSHLRLIFINKASILFSDLLQESRLISHVFNSFCKKLLELTRAYRNKSYLDFMKQIEVFERLITTLECKDYSSRIRDIDRFLSISLNLNQSIFMNNKPEIAKLKDIGNLILKINRSQKKGYGNVIDKVISFIDNNYMYNISIIQIAKTLSITPNYLSSLFHKLVGTTFMKYLTRMRMLKARELLLIPGAKINEVSFKVGYLNPNHFTRIFKEYWNFPPSTFQKQHDIKS